MARTTELRCDICRKPTRKIVGKLHFIPMIAGVSRGVHSNYTHHADVGECCKDRLFKGFNFNKRMTKDEYNEKRRNGNSVGASKS
jgi:hypothetical protein